MSAKLSLAVIASVASVACTSNVVGTGRLPTTDEPPSGDSVTNGVDQVDPKLTELFSPPTSSSVTSDDVFGLWVASSTMGDVDERLKIGASGVIYAAKCMDSGEIAHVEVAARASSSKITLLETKTATFKSSWPCPKAITLTAGEWKACGSSGADFSVACFEIDDTTLTFHFLSDLPTRWTKLSD